MALAAAITSGVGLVNDIENGMFEKVLVTPMNRTVVFVGKTAAEVFRIAVQIGTILGLGALLGAEIVTGIVGAVGIIAIGVLFSLWFVAFSNALAILTRDQESTIIGAICCSSRCCSCRAHSFRSRHSLIGFRYSLASTP